MQKQKKRKRSNSQDTITAAQLLEKDALHIIKTRYNRHYSSLKEINLIEIRELFLRKSHDSNSDLPHGGWSLSPATHLPPHPLSIWEGQQIITVPFSLYKSGGGLVPATVHFCSPEHTATQNTSLVPSPSGHAPGRNWAENARNRHKERDLCESIVPRILGTLVLNFPLTLGKWLQDRYPCCPRLLRTYLNRIT